MARVYKTRAWRDQLSPAIDEMELLAMRPMPHCRTNSEI